MPTVIDVDTDSYSAASALFGQDLSPGVLDVAKRLGSALLDSSGMAGSDPVGTTWGAQYDPAAADAYAVI